MVEICIKISLFELTQVVYPEPITDFKQASKINKPKTFGVRKKVDPLVAKAVFLKHGLGRRNSN